VVLELELELEDGADHDDDEIVRLEEKAGAGELERLLLLDVVGAGLVVEVVGGGGGGAAELDLDGELEGEVALDPSVWKTTMLADLPLGTVTTQKLAPPTPSALTGLLTPLISIFDGSISQGVPLQPPPGHSIRTPYDGLTLPRGQSV
jgi:hypothetical protein